MSPHAIRQLWIDMTAHADNCALCRSRRPCRTGDMLRDEWQGRVMNDIDIRLPIQALVSWGGAK